MSQQIYSLPPLATWVTYHTFLELEHHSPSLPFAQGSTAQSEGAFSQNSVPLSTHSLVLEILDFEMMMFVAPEPELAGM